MPPTSSRRAAAQKAVNPKPAADKYWMRSVTDVRFFENYEEIRFNVLWWSNEKTWEPLKSFDGRLQHQSIRNFLKDPDNRRKYEDALRTEKEMRNEKKKNRSTKNPPLPAPSNSLSPGMPAPSTSISGIVPTTQAPAAADLSVNTTTTGAPQGDGNAPDARPTGPGQLAAIAEPAAAPPGPSAKAGSSTQAPLAAASDTSANGAIAEVQQDVDTNRDASTTPVDLIASTKPATANSEEQAASSTNSADTAPLVPQAANSSFNAVTNDAAGTTAPETNTPGTSSSTALRVAVKPPAPSPFSQAPSSSTGPQDAVSMLKTSTLTATAAKPMSASPGSAALDSTPKEALQGAIPPPVPPPVPSVPQDTAPQTSNPVVDSPVNGAIDGGTVPIARRDVSSRVATTHFEHEVWTVSSDSEEEEVDEDTAPRTSNPVVDSPVNGAIGNGAVPFVCGDVPSRIAMPVEPDVVTLNSDSEEEEENRGPGAGQRPSADDSPPPNARSSQASSSQRTTASFNARPSSRNRGPGAGQGSRADVSRRQHRSSYPSRSPSPTLFDNRGLSQNRGPGIEQEQRTNASPAHSSFSNASRSQETTSSSHTRPSSQSGSRSGRGQRVDFPPPHHRSSHASRPRFPRPAAYSSLASSSRKRERSRSPPAKKLSLDDIESGFEELSYRDQRKFLQHYQWNLSRKFKKEGENCCFGCFRKFSASVDSSRYPRFLSNCGHTSCQGCLKSWKDEGEKGLKCPLCEVKFDIHRIEDLPTESIIFKRLEQEEKYEDY